MKTSTGLPTYEQTSGIIKGAADKFTSAIPSLTAPRTISSVTTNLGSGGGSSQGSRPSPLDPLGDDLFAPSNANNNVNNFGGGGAADIFAPSNRNDDPLGDLL